MNGKADDQVIGSLKRAVEAGDKFWVDCLLKRTPQLNCYIGGKILWTAVLNGQLEIASMLIKSGANLNVKKIVNGRELSLLHGLVESNHQQHHELAVLMMQHGVEVNDFDSNGYMPLDCAIRVGSSAYTIKQLLKHGALFDSADIVEAAGHPQAAELMALLFGECDDIKIKSRRINNALLYCAMYDIDNSKASSVAELLLKMKFSMAEMVSAKHILRHAIRSNNIKLVKLLIEHGFEVNGTDYSASTPLYLASESKESTITQLLIQAGAEVNALSVNLNRERGKEYAIHVACQNDSIANIQVLLRNGADINLIDAQSRTPFSLIEFRGYLSEAHQIFIRHLALLMSKGRKINDYDMDIILNNHMMFEYYNQCLLEVEQMKMSTVINNISFFSIFVDNVGELAFSIKNPKFTEKYNKVSRRDIFPLYCNDMDSKFLDAVRRRALLSEKEQVVSEMLENILPILPLERIVFYLYFNEAK